MRTYAILLAAWLAGCGGERAAPSDAGPVGEDSGGGLDQGEVDGGAPDQGAPDMGHDAGLPEPSSCASGGAGFVAFGELPEPRESHVSLPFGEAVLLLGGWDGGRAREQAWIADGAGVRSLDWSLPSARQHAGASFLAGRLCLIGGDDGRLPTDAVHCLQLDGRGAALGDWEAGPTLPSPRTAHEVVQLGSKVYVIGGLETFEAASSSAVYRSQLDAEGRLSAWSEVSSLPRGLAFAAAAATEDAVFVAGGASSQGLRAELLAAPVLEDGGLGAWEEVGRLDTPGYGAVLRAFDGRLWHFGGADRSGLHARVHSWALPDTPRLVEETPLPEPRLGHGIERVGEGLLGSGGWRSLDAPPSRQLLWRDCSR